MRMRRIERMLEQLQLQQHFWGVRRVESIAADPQKAVGL
jgi:hypothetical protein